MSAERDPEKPLRVSDEIFSILVRAGGLEAALKQHPGLMVLDCGDVYRVIWG